MTIFNRIIDGIAGFARNTETIGLEVGVLVHSIAWWIVIAIPVSTVLQSRLTASAPEWAWGAALCIASFGHIVLIVLREAGQNSRMNLISRDVVCLFDAGLWTYILAISLYSPIVPFAVGTAAAQVLCAIMAGVSIALKLVHTSGSRAAS